MRVWLLILVVMAVTTGCTVAYPYSSMASHTVRADANRDVDVVWLQEISGKLYRCSQVSDGPVCVAVKL